MFTGLHYQRIVIGYHGCDASIVRRVLIEHQPLAASENDYDWLGRGVYFWEYGPERALDWAREVAQRRPDRIQKPAVLGAILNLGQCFDFLDLRFTRHLASIYPRFVQDFEQDDIRPPTNSGLSGHGEDHVLRRLDCAVINWAIDSWEKAETTRFDSVPGVFQEGGPAYVGSGIRLKSHIQVAVRNRRSVIGYFQPTIDDSREQERIIQ